MSQNSTAHWSIGEVLSLLQAEFPEVTISKIRFLESQGLIDPERTPSGYRRFYDHDFDRLRWILVQQRDHYLPLKVIRDRLELADDLGAPQPESGDDIEIVQEPEVAPGSDLAAEHETAAESELASESELAAEAEPAPEAEPEKGVAVSDDQEVLPLLDLTEDAALPAESLVLPVPDVEMVTLVPNPQPQAQEEVETVSPVQDPPSREDHSPPENPTPPEQPVAEELALSREELAEAAGCDTRLLHELERYNLIAGHSMANGLVFGQHDLDVALTAVAFGERGLEPRHLRAFRLSAEREVGLVAQIVEPMLHRRSAGAREASYTVLAEMMDLATTLHDSMVRQVVEEQFPNR